MEAQTELKTEEGRFVWEQLQRFRMPEPSLIPLLNAGKLREVKEICLAEGYPVRLLDDIFCEVL